MSPIPTTTATVSGCGAETRSYSLRLYFVDAPETNLRYPDRTREQAEHYGITLDEALNAGRAARDLVRAMLKEPFTVWTRWASAAGRGAEPRYYAFILVGEQALDELLVAKGLAQPKGIRPNLPTGEKAADHQKKLEALQAEARKQKAGAWATSTRTDLPKEAPEGEGK